jgi:tripartite ATP-independent transporter DctP family solute receptor
MPESDGSDPNRREHGMNTSSMLRNLVRSVLAASIASAMVGIAGAQAPTVVRLGHVGYPGSLFAISSDEYAKRVNAALKGKVEVKVFHSSQLGSDEDMLRGIKVGVLEMFLPSTIMSTVDPRFGVFEMPYLFNDREHVKRVFEEPKVRSLLLEPLAQKGLHVLGVWENGFRVITNNVRPIAKPDDLKGIKLRVPSGVWRVKMFRAYGANPAPLAYSEVFAALQAGVMDGEENPFAQIYAGKFYEVQKYLSLSNHVYTPAFLVVSEQFWKRLPPDVQQVLAKTAAEVGDFARSEGARLDREILEKMMQGKTKVNDVDRNAFVKASAPVYDDFGKEVAGGKDLIDRIVALRKP